MECDSLLVGADPVRATTSRHPVHIYVTYPRYTICTYIYIYIYAWAQRVWKSFALARINRVLLHIAQQHRNIFSLKYPFPRKTSTRQQQYERDWKPRKVLLSVLYDTKHTTAQPIILILERVQIYAFHEINRANYCLYSCTEYPKYHYTPSNK